MPQLDPTWFASQIFWLAVTFSLLYLLMSGWLVPRIRDVLEGRQGHIDHDLNRAESLRIEAERIRTEYERRLAQARSEAQSTVQQQLDALRAEHQEKQHKLQTALDSKIHDAEATVTEAHRQAIQDITPAVTSLTTAIVTQVCATTAKSPDVKAAVAQVLRDGGVAA